MTWFAAASQEQLFSKFSRAGDLTLPFVNPPRRILAGEVRVHGGKNGGRSTFYGIARRFEAIVIGSLYRVGCMFWKSCSQ
jgi:hypothetical protein